MARDFDRPQLGHSCPGYLFYVDANDEVPLVCMETKEDYASAFVQSLDLLIGCNGGEQAFMQDIASVFRHKRHFMPVNVLACICSGGTPQGVTDGKISDAVTAFHNFVHLIDMQSVPVSADRYQEMLLKAGERARAIARRSGNLSPQVAFVNLAQQLPHRHYTASLLARVRQCASIEARWRAAICCSHRAVSSESIWVF